MATTINNIKVDFGLGAAPARVTFLQGADMDVTSIRTTIRQIEESEEGRDGIGAVTEGGTGKGWICQAGGNFQFTESESSALTLEILPPYDIFFEAGAIPFQSSTGSLLGTFVESPGAIVQINNAIGATNLQSGDIQHASFDGGVHVDVTSSQTGSAYPSGNSANPVNNWADAKVVDDREGFRQYFVDESATLDAAVDFTDAAFVGKSIIDTVLAVPSGTTVDKCEFTNLSLEGSLGETTIMQRCFLGETNPLLDVRGVVEDCSIGPSPLTLGGSATQTVRFVRCNGAGEDTSPATVNGGGNGPKFDVQDYTGALKIANKTGQAFWDIHVTGELIIDSTCIAGVIRATGAGNLTDESGDDCTVIDEMLKPAQVTEMWRLQGLEFGNPMTVTETARSVADQSVSLGLTGDGITTQTVTRQTDQTLIFDAKLGSDLIDDSDTAANATFTRASTGRYVSTVTGLVTEAAIDTPRYELGGLLIEGASTNIVQRSEEFGSWSTIGAGSVNADTAVAPDGASTADQLIDDGGATGTVNVGLAQGVIVATSTAYTFSCYMKADQLTWGALRLVNFTTPGTTIAYFDLINGLEGTQGAGWDDTGMEDAGNGWWRCWGTFTTDAGDTTGSVRAYVAEADGDFGVDDDGTSSIFIWGAQCEAGGMSSYIPTTTASVTRDADFLSYDDEIVVNALGSMIASITPNGANLRDAVVANITDQLVGPLYLLDSSGQKAAIGDGTTVNSVALTLTDNSTSKVASRWSTADNEIEVIADGVAAGTSAYDDAFTRTAGTLYIGSDSTGNHINGNIKSVKIYNVDRGTAQLQVDTG